LLLRSVKRLAGISTRPVRRQLTGARRSGTPGPRESGAPGMPPEVSGMQRRTRTTWYRTDRRSLRSGQSDLRSGHASAGSRQGALPVIHCIVWTDVSGCPHAVVGGRAAMPGLVDGATRSRWCYVRRRSVSATAVRRTATPPQGRLGCVTYQCEGDSWPIIWAQPVSIDLKWP
jgi:hypothetical protein